MSGHDVRAGRADLLASVQAAEESEARARRAPLPFDAAPVPIPEPEPFCTVRVLQGEPPSPPEVHVSDLLVAEDVNLFAGHGGSGKSVVGLLTAVCVALSRPVFGTLPVHRSGPVLLVLPEDGESNARMIFDAIAAGLALDAPERERLGESLIMIPDDAPVNIARDARRLGRTARDAGAVLVVLDPLRNLLAGADENDNSIAGVTVDAIRREVCRAAGATVLVTHHVRKPGKETASDAAPSVHDSLGAGGWANGARLVFGVSKSGDRVTLSGLKANRLRAGIRHELDLAIEADPTNAARWLTCTVTDANAGAHSESLTPGVGRELNPNERATLAALDDRHEPGQRLSWSRWRDESGINKDTWRKARERLKDAGLVAAHTTGKKNPNGSPRYEFALTEAGRQALATGWASPIPSVSGVTNCA